MLPIFTKRCNKSNWRCLLETATISSLGLSTYWFYKFVQSYGWCGTLRYIWEGDPLSREIRQLVDILQAVSQSLDKIGVAILTLEKELERARLDSIDGASPADILNLWRTNLHYTEHDLRKHLATVSHDLDVMASKVDQIPTKEEVRQRKKELSSHTVLLMARADRLIEFFTIATQH